MFPQIVIGTYEEFVLGYNPKYEDESNNKCKLIQTFATHSHQASVRCVAAHKNLMASSGADEYINIYDMLAMEVSTVINYHNSTVTCLEFTPDGTHLATANQNGDIAIFRCRDWTLVKLWKGAHKHANGVVSMNIHPSGSLLLTTGADNIVRFWNLVKGRQAYATNFSKKCSVGNFVNFGTWSKDGNYYAVCIGNKLEVYTTGKAALIYEITTKTRITSAVFTKKNLLCVGTEEGLVEVHSISNKELIIKDQFHKTRIKCLVSFHLNNKKNEKDILQNYLVSVDSKGGIKLWYLRKKKLTYCVELKGEADCDCRITCLTTVAFKDIKEEKKESLESVNEMSQDVIIENNVEKDSSTDKSSGSLKVKAKKLKKGLKISNKESAPKISGTPKQKPQANGQESITEESPAAKNKKRTLSESDFTEKEKKKSGSLKQFKKKKLSNSLSFEKTKSKRTPGKWSIEPED